MHPNYGIELLTAIFDWLKSIHYLDYEIPCSNASDLCGN